LWQLIAAKKLKDRKESSLDPLPEEASEATNIVDYHVINRATGRGVSRMRTMRPSIGTGRGDKRSSWKRNE
jgi:hypothetical protein